MEIAIITGLTTIVIVLIVVIAIARQGGSMQVGKDGVSMSTDKAPPKPRHSRCPASREIMAVLESAAETEARIMQMRHTTIEEQMKYAEAVNVEVQQRMQGAFISLLHDRVPDEVVTHPEFNQFQATLRLHESIIRDYMRKWFRENHYSDRSREDEENYIEQKVVTVLALTTDIFNLYWRGVVIPRSDLYKMNLEYEDDMKTMLRDIFKQAFIISRNMAAETARLRSEHESLLRQIITG